MAIKADPAALAERLDMLRLRSEASERSHFSGGISHVTFGPVEDDESREWVLIHYANGGIVHVLTGWPMIFTSPENH